MSKAHPNGSVTHIGPKQYEITTEIYIDAPASVVWATLTDFERMPEWSSSFQGFDGDFHEGARITTLFKVLGQVLRNERTLVELEDGKSWAWTDPEAETMRDYHVYRVEPVTETTSRFVQTDRSEDGAFDLVNRADAHVKKKAYAAFNEELKAEVERRYAEAA